MRKKILSVLVSIVLLYVTGCSKYDGKIGLNTNPKSLNPTATPAQPAVPKQRPGISRPTRWHVGNNLTPLQLAENKLLDLLLEADDFQQMTILYRRPLGQEGFYKGELEAIQNEIQIAEYKVAELRAQTSSRTDSAPEAPVSDPIQQEIQRKRKAYLRYASAIQELQKSQAHRVRVDGEQAKSKQLEIFIHDFSGLLGITAKYLRDMDKEWYDANKIPDPILTSNT
jgi:hypothetical protein